LSLFEGKQPHSFVTFPVYLRVGSLRIHPHIFFESLAYVIGFTLFLFLRWRRGDPVSDDFRWWVIAAAVTGAALGCRLLGWLEAPTLNAIMSGKTIVGGLAGGLVAVELVKKRLGVMSATGDLFAIPLAAGIAIGRIGCFLTGLADQTYGSPTSLPWGVDFGDGVARHPTQLYEMAFLAVLVLILFKFSRRPHDQGDVFKVFMIGYMGWRLLVDFIKPAQRVFGVSPIQIVCLLILIYYFRDVVRIVGSLGHDNNLVEG
jgi:phosphatidylglycerol:prolipoprotein diacylglycerol transferase